MKKIRVGIIGQGRSGKNIHAKCLIGKLQDQYEIVAVCDLRPERNRETGEETGCAVYTDYREMLQRRDLDLVVNATMSHQHAEVNLDVIASGHRLLAEKPLARTVTEVDTMVAAARKRDVLLAVFQQSRFSPTFRKVKEVVDSGLLGRTVMIKVAFNGFARRWDWQTLQCRTAGNLYNTGPHPLDQALQFIPEGIVPEVYCRMDRANTFGDAEDQVKMIMSAKDQPVIDLEISSCAAYSPYVYQVYGTNGGLTGDHAHLEWKYFKPEEAPERHLIREPMADRQYCTEQLKWYTDSWDSTPEELDFNFRVAAFYGSLYATIVDGAPLAVTVAQVRRQIAVIESCHRQNPLPRLFEG